MAVISPSVLAFVAVCTLVVGIYKFVVYPAFLSPLSKIPNAHFTAPVTPLWILWRRFRMRGNRTIHEAHEKYGPIVRLGPSELSINCVDGGIRTVYAGGFEKHDWYPRVFGSFGYVGFPLDVILLALALRDLQYHQHVLHGWKQIPFHA